MISKKKGSVDTDIVFSILSKIIYKEEFDKIDVSAGIKEYATIFGVGYLVIILAMIAPSVNIFRYQPKTILSGKE